MRIIIWFYFEICLHVNHMSLFKIRVGNMNTVGRNMVSLKKKYYIKCNFTIFNGWKLSFRFYFVVFSVRNFCIHFYDEK